MIRWLAALCLLAGSNAASARDLALLKIRIDRYEDFHPYSSSCDEKGPSDQECVSVGGFLQYRVTLITTFACSVPRKSFVMMFPMAHRWAVPNTFYVLTDSVEHELETGKKYILVQDWKPVSWGFCLLEGESGAQYGMAKQVAALRRDHPCKAN